MQMGSVLIAAPVHQVLLDGLTKMGYECILKVDIKQDDGAEWLSNCEGVVTSTRLQLNKELLDSAPKLKWIGRMGSGMEVIDVAYATQKGIACYSSPEGNCGAVAEHAVGMLLALARNIVLADGEMRVGIWRREENRGWELAGKTIGIIGVGYTGSAFARLMLAFGAKLIGYDTNIEVSMPEGVERCASIANIYELADVVSFHVPQAGDTYHYFNSEFIASMQRPFVLINTSRGQVVDTPALVKGLASGKVLGACLDVYEQEPPFGMSGGKLMQSLLEYGNKLIITPHIAGYTTDALLKMSEVVLKKVSKWVSEQ